MSRIFTVDQLPALVAALDRNARRQLPYDGKPGPHVTPLMRRSAAFLSVDALCGLLVIYTRDIGYHSSGWWKNPDYERCFHLSLSLRGPQNEPLPLSKEWGQRVARAFWGDDARMAWIEGPYSPEGKAFDVWHYRLFCERAWTPILPRGEVYDTTNTPPEWRSFSEIHGWSPAPENAPFLLAAAR